MQLSVIIVNFNTKHLLEQCLRAVADAAVGLQHEIIIVDNNSTDGSKEQLPGLFPEVRFVFNTNNEGFAKGCNKGLSFSSGQFILFLNPDTRVSQDSLHTSISFLQEKKEAGAVGVRMVNENGEYLKESKRGEPTPATSFYKLFGLSALFPRSPVFSKYYMGHLSENTTSCVDVLSGAFMMVKREVLQMTGGFDEDYFMYGEDIDLSLRILQAGYKNYYLGEVYITHIKGGSTVYNYKYVQDFYGAMQLFVKKHYAGKKPLLYTMVLMAGIRVRKWIALAGLVFR